MHYQRAIGLLTDKTAEMDQISVRLVRPAIEAHKSEFDSEFKGRPLNRARKQLRQSPGGHRLLATKSRDLTMFAGGMLVMTFVAALLESINARDYIGIALIFAGAFLVRDWMFLPAFTPAGLLMESGLSKRDINSSEIDDADHTLSVIELLDYARALDKQAISNSGCLNTEQGRL